MNRAEFGTATCLAPIPGEYITSGQVYKFQVSGRTVTYNRASDGSGSFMSIWVWEKAIDAGKIRIDAANPYF